MFGRKVEVGELLGHSSMGGRKVETGKSSMTMPTRRGRSVPFLPGGATSNLRPVGVMASRKLEGVLPLEYVRTENHLELQRTQREYGTDPLSRLARLGITTKYTR